MNMTSELALPLLLLSPLAAAFMSLVSGFLKKSSLETAGFLLWLTGTLGGILLSASVFRTGASLLYPMGGWLEPYGIVMEIEGLTLVATLTDIIIAGAAWLHSRRFRRYGSTFSFFFFLALFSLQGIMLTRDLFNLFVWFEVLSLCSFLLITYFRSSETLMAAIRYLLISSVSVAFYLVGLWILYTHTGSLSLAVIGEMVSPGAGAGAFASNLAPTLSSALGPTLSSTFAPALPGAFSPALAASSLRQIGFAAALITAGILTRAAIIPFHTWLPAAHSAAPYPVSALLSGFVIKAPMIALWRFLDYLPCPGLGEPLLWLGAAGALFGVAAAMVQRDAKKLLAYHSVSQMGYIIAAFGAGGVLGKTAGLFYIVGHAMFKGLLFLTVGEVTDRAGSRDVYRLRGLFRFFPYQGILFFIAAAAISGVPFFAGFSAKALVSKALASGAPTSKVLFSGVLARHPAEWLLLAAGIGTAASFFKLGRIFPGSASPETAERLEVQPQDLVAGGLQKTFAYLSMALLGLGCIALGIFPGLFESLFAGPAARAPVKLLWGGFARFYYPVSLLKSGASLIAGFGLSFFLLSRRGKNLSHMIRHRELGLNGALRLLLAGFIFFALLGAGAFGFFGFFP
jgi:multicomponent Na+:H+ antiporter subunit D